MSDSDILITITVLLAFKNLDYYCYLCHGCFGQTTQFVCVFGVSMVPFFSCGLNSRGKNDNDMY